MKYCLAQSNKYVQQQTSYILFNEKNEKESNVCIGRHTDSSYCKNVFKNIHKTQILKFR